MNTNLGQTTPGTTPSSPRPIPLHEIRSPGMQEIMSEIPGSFLKWGLFLFFGIIMAFLGVSWFIRSPDIVTAPLTITTFNPPVSLIARSDGKIEKFFVMNGSDIEKNQPVALIGNQAKWEDVQRIEGFIKSIRDSVTWDKIVNTLTPPSGLHLGEIQNSLMNFTGSYLKFSEYIRQAYLPAKLIYIDKQMTQQEEYVKEMKNQELLSAEDLKLTYNNFKRDSNLYNGSNYSISVNELERSKQALLQKQISLSSLHSSIKNTESSILKMKEKRLDLVIQYENEVNRFKSDLEASFQMLKVAIGQWKEKYLIESPINGKITFTSYWSENQIINSGDLLAMIIPENSQHIIVRANIPISGSGKVKTGQEVNIKLNSYSYMEFGMLKGRIISVSLIPIGETFIADIDLTNGLKTSYNLEVGYINGATGTADIIIENKRLLNKFIKPLRSVINIKPIN